MRIDQHLRGSRRSPKVLVTTDQGRYLLKRRARGRDHPLKVTFAHGVQQHLAARDFPLPRLIPVKDGSDTMVMLDQQIYELFEYVTGDHYDKSAEATADAGRVLGLLHKCLSSYQFDWEPSSRGYHDISLVRTHLNDIPATVGKDDSVVGKESELLSTVTGLYDAYEAAAEQVSQGRYSALPHQIVHADWHPGNMLFRGGRVTAVIDYDSLRLQPAITDLANGMLQFSILGGPIDPREWPAELDEDRLSEFISGYEQEFPIEADLLGLLPSLMIEALIAEAVVTIAATGSFGRLEGFRFLKMILRKVRWLEQNGSRLMAEVQV